MDEFSENNNELSENELSIAKSQGCLLNRDRTLFSVRVITRNGVLTAAEMAAAAQAAEKFGTGAVALTTRLTVEIQGVPYENLAPLRDFLETHGLLTGGTGAKVRPIVACKGTVCVYGLIDTQGLALKIHKAFYEGYRHVGLPQKFKITVGGCPNNCAKADLNDIGIIG